MRPRLKAELRPARSESSARCGCRTGPQGAAGFEAEVGGDVRRRRPDAASRGLAGWSIRTTCRPSTQSGSAGPPNPEAPERRGAEKAFHDWLAKERYGADAAIFDAMNNPTNRGNAARQQLPRHRPGLRRCVPLTTTSCPSRGRRTCHETDIPIDPRGWPSPSWSRTVPEPSSPTSSPGRTSSRSPRSPRRSTRPKSRVATSISKRSAQRRN